MISPEQTVVANQPPHGEARPAEGRVAVQLDKVSKVYRLYGSPREQVLDSLGFNRLLFRKGRNAYQEFHALRDISLTVRRGERIGIIGRNGAGKTTLLKLITGNFAATTGTVEVNGSVQALMEMGLGFHPEFSGYENIRSSLLYNGLAGAEFEEALADVIDFAELGQFLHQPMKTYSLGMGARVQFAAATAIKPDILIIDEVMGAGDAYFAGKSAHRMEKLTASGYTLLLVSHSTQQVLQFCQNAVWLEQGQIQLIGDAIDVIKAYEEYIEHMTRHENARSQAADTAVPAAVPAAATSGQLDFSTAEWQKERMVSMLDTSQTHGVKGTVGKGISRWPAEKGLKIVRVEVLNKDGVATNTIHSGCPLDIEIEFVAEKNGDFDCRFVVLLMTLDGVSLTRHLSEPFHFALMEGETRSVRLRYRSTLLASGEFIFSAGLFKQYDPNNCDSAIRYDLLSRSFKLKIVPRHASEPAFFHHPSEWLAAPFPPSQT